MSRSPSWCWRMVNSSVHDNGNDADHPIGWTFRIDCPRAESMKFFGQKSDPNMQSEGMAQKSVHYSS